MTRSVGIVVPAYRPDVSVLVEYLVDVERELEPETLRVELDAPTDETLEALRETSATINAVDHRRGKGAAITAGFEALSTDVLAFADADGSTPAESIRAVVDAVETGNSDVAVGSRRHPDADVRSHQTVLRQHLGDAFAWIARRFLGPKLRDYQCGAKAMTRETWLAIREHLYEPGFAWDVEVIAMADAFGFEITEVPVIWIDHPDSTVTTTSAVPELLWALFSARNRAKMLMRGQLHGTGSGGETTTPNDERPLVEREE
ncbi:MAG: glycosyltransferase [Halodesulfurarchaeum sp.]|nr:glycosyltransferase [Halodesulfurarchaeum sp.]